MTIISRYLLWGSCLILSACSPAVVAPLTMSNPAHPDAQAGIAPPRSRTLEVKNGGEIKKSKRTEEHSLGHGMNHRSEGMAEGLAQIKKESGTSGHQGH
jgi:hypothetical protein